MEITTMTSKGQITIPAPVRRALGVRPGDRIEFKLRADGVVELVPHARDIRELFGVLVPAVRGVTLADMDRAVREGASRP